MPENSELNTNSSSNSDLNSNSTLILNSNQQFSSNSSSFDQDQKQINTINSQNLQNFQQIHKNHNLNQGFDQLANFKSSSESGSFESSLDHNLKQHSVNAPLNSLSQQISDSTLANDLMLLESIDWYKEMVIKLRRGIHPNPEIDKLLDRCFKNIPKDKVMVNLPIRYLLTFAWVFVMCTLTWIVIWAIGKIFELNEFLWLASGLMTTIFAALIGLSFSHPIVFIDEKALLELGTQEIQKLKSTLGLLEIAKRVENDSTKSN